MAPGSTRKGKITKKYDKDRTMASPFDLSDVEAFKLMEQLDVATAKAQWKKDTNPVFLQTMYGQLHTGLTLYESFAAKAGHSDRAVRSMKRLMDKLIKPLLERDPNATDLNDSDSMELDEEIDEMIQERKEAAAEKSKSEGLGEEEPKSKADKV